MSLRVYFFLFCGWGSGRRYSLLGRYRSVSQTVSYEISIIFFVLVFNYIILCFDFSLFYVFQTGYWFCLVRIVLFRGWLFSCLAELNRTPFDFSEGESELVSGFNVEYRGGIFSLIFICEYGIIIYLTFLRNRCFMGVRGFFWKALLGCLVFVWIRGRFPRFRYDLLILVSWETILPLIIFCLVLRIRILG